MACRQGSDLRQHLALTAELTLAALACAGAWAGYHLESRPDWSSGASFSDVAGLERRCDIVFPPGSTLVVSHYKSGFPACVSAVVRSPEPPTLAAGGFEPSGGGDPTVPVRRGAAGLPEPSSLGLHGTPREVGRNTYDFSSGSGTQCSAWLFAGGPAPETVTYVQWEQTP